MSDSELVKQLLTANDIVCVGVDSQDGKIRGVHLVINNKTAILIFAVPLQGNHACLGLNEE